MLSRILEPEVMDSPAEARDYDAMDHSRVNHVFVADFLAFWQSDGTILDIGTGTAQIPIECCRQHPTLKIVAVDLAVHMLELARTSVRQAGFAHRIELRHIDAKRLPFADGCYAAVISNSIVHHIPKPKLVLAEAVRVTRPGGTLFVRDLIRPDSEREIERLVTKYAGDGNAHQQKMFADSLGAALTVEEVRALVKVLGYDGERVQQTSDRHWTWAARVASNG